MNTKTLRALIAEDEPILAQALEQALQRLWPELQIAGIAGNGAAAVEQALAQRPDVLFFDIKMPGKSGLEAAHELAEEWPEDSPFPLIVFVTAYDQFALQAFEQAAIDYVLKPVSDTRLSTTVKRLQTRLDQHHEPGEELQRVLGQLRTLVPAAPSGTERLAVIRAAVGNQIRLIPINDVLYFEATDKYVNVVTAAGDALIRTSLKELLPQLDGNQFWQIHRGTVVNVSRVQAAIRDEFGKLSVKLRDRPETLAISRVFAHLFKQM
jgi:DNA-binding LytR/AlgR family response regulator